MYIQWPLITGSTVHTVASQYRFYCSSTLFGAIIRDVLNSSSVSGKEDVIVCGVVLPMMAIVVVVVVLLMVIIVLRTKRGCSKLVQCLFMCTHRCN